MEAGARRGMPEKIREAYAPVPFWFTGLFMVFPKTSAAGYLPVGLYMVFLRSSQRPHPVAKAPRKPDGLHGDHPASGTHKDRHPFPARAWVFYGLCEDRFPM